MRNIRLTKAHKANAIEIDRLAQTFGHLPVNAYGQTTNELCNLAIPMSYFVKNDMVTALPEGSIWECLDDHVVEEVRTRAAQGVALAVERHGNGWWNDAKLEQS